MRTVLKSMLNKKIGIPEDVIIIFEDIITSYFVPGRGSKEGDIKFTQAMERYLTKEQLYKLWEKHGGCQGTGHDKERRDFALTHKDKTLSEKLEIYLSTLGKNKIAVLNDDNTLAVIFTCPHGPKFEGDRNEKTSLEFHYGRCAGGRLYEYQKILGVKLKVNSVEVPPNISNETPVVFTFEII
jgi:hypothetical protein